MPTLSSKKMTKFECRECRDHGFEEGTVYYQPYGSSEKRFCNECDKGKRLFKAWLQEPSTQESIRKHKKERMERAMKLSSLIPNYESARIEDLKDKSKLHETCTKYIENWPEIKKHGFGYYFWGNVGSGKTHTAAIIANELQKRYLAEVLFLKMPEAVSRVKRSFDTTGKNPDVNLFKKMRTVELLVLDDLGIEKVSDWLADEMYQIVDHRTSHNLPMIITSNQSLDDLKKVYREQVSSRICGKSKSIHFAQKDRRQKEQEEIKQTLF